MRRRRNPLFSSNLDALMDTMTNVVGILIMILILMQVGVGQTLKKIVSELPQVSAEELEQIKEEAEEQRAKFEQLKETIEKQNLRTEGERTELAHLNPQLSTLETTAERMTVPILEKATIRGKSLDNSREVDALRRQVAELLLEQSRLKAALDTTPVLTTPPPDRIVHIPNSRPLAETAKMERFLIMPGQIYNYDPEAAKKLFQQEFQTAKTKLEKERYTPVNGTMQIIYDQDKVVKYFEQRHLMVGGLEVQVLPNPTGTRLSMEVAPKPGAGLAIETAAKFGSHFMDELRRIKSSGGIVWFNVTKGSFDTYLQAREVCEMVGAPAGWDLVQNVVVREQLNDFEVNRTVEPPPPPPPRTPPPGTPKPVVAKPPMPKAAPPATPIKIDPPKKKID